MKLSILAGATSQSINIFVRDSSSSTGGGLTGLVYNTASLAAYYSHAGANATATVITLATLAAVNSAWSSGGFKEIDATNMPGWYRLDLPNAVLATSKGRSVALHLKGATNMAPTPIEIELTGWDNQDTVRGGMTSLPNAAAGANGGLPTGDASGRVDVSKIAGTSQTARDIGASVLLSSGTGTGQLDFTSGVVKANVTQNAGSAITSAAGIQEVKVASLATGAITAASIAADAITDAKVASDVTIASVTGAVGSVTGNVGGNVTGSVGSVAPGGIASTSFAAGAITAAAIAADAIGASELAADAVSEIAGAVWDVTLASHLTGGTTGNALNAAGAAGDPWSTALPGAYSAGSAGYIIGTNVNAQASSLATAANLAVVAGYLDTEIAAIKAKTDNLPSDPADQSAVEAAITAALTLDLTEAYRADGSPGSVAELLYEIVAHLGESSISGTTKTIRKVNGSTTAATFTLDDATTPTSITRAS